MKASQLYKLLIRDLFSTSNGALCGAEAVVAIFDGEAEIDRLSFKGKVGPGGDGNVRTYTAKSGLKARIVSGPGSINMESVLS